MEDKKKEEPVEEEATKPVKGKGEEKESQKPKRITGDATKVPEVEQ